MDSSLRFAAIAIGGLLASGAAYADAEVPDAGLLEADAGNMAPASAPAPYTFGGYAEGLYSWNFNNPSNGITNFRGFDNRHNSFTISNIALDATWDFYNVVGRVTLQVGHTPSTYYLAEPASPGASGANASGIDLWKYVQQAYAGYRFPLGGGLTALVGIFLSPIGPEGMAVKDNWNWSRSNLFFGLPFYHTGIRATYNVTETLAVTLAGYNGWNSVVDNNPEKSISAQVTYTSPQLVFSALYFGGVERAVGAPEGRPWRHTFDAHATWNISDRFSMLVHGDVGFEPTRFGMSGWVAGALAGRVRILDPLYFAARIDAFYEYLGTNADGTAGSIFWPVAWVASGTATVDYRPHEKVSIRLEYRHDHAPGDMYFAGTVAGDGVTTPFVPNRRTQDTLTLGVTAWF